MNSLAEAALMFRSWTADRRLLVVLDKVRSGDTLRHLFPSGSGCALVVVSRTPIDGLPGAVRLRLPVLSVADATAPATPGTGYVTTAFPLSCDTIVLSPPAAAALGAPCGLAQRRISRS